MTVVEKLSSVPKKKPLVVLLQSTLMRSSRLSFLSSTSFSEETRFSLSPLAAGMQKEKRGKTDTDCHRALLACHISHLVASTYVTARTT